MNMLWFVINYYNCPSSTLSNNLNNDMDDSAFFLRMVIMICNDPLRLLCRYAAKLVAGVLDYKCMVDE